MNETSTKNLFAVANNMLVKEKTLSENLNADELMFFHALRDDLALLERKPKLQTIHQILDFSKNHR